MKNIIHSFLIPAFVVLIFFISCKKEYSCENYNASLTNQNKPPIAVAGPDMVVTLPTDSVSLDGTRSGDGMG
jgi:hypothetical protein